MAGLAVTASAAPAPSFQLSLAAASFSPVVGPAVNFRTQVCGLRCWVAAKLKLQKALKRHGWQVQIKLEVRGDAKIPDCLEVASLTEKRAPWNVQSACESGGETAKTSSDTLDGIVDETSSMHLRLNPSESDPPVLKEDLVLFDHFTDQPESVPSLCIAVIGATTAAPPTAPPLSSPPPPPSKHWEMASIGVGRSVSFGAANCLHLPGRSGPSAIGVNADELSR